MPLYEYIHTQGFAEPCQSEVIELVHSMHAAELTLCPYCQKPVRKTLTRLNAISSTADKLSEGNLARNGFSKYVKTEDGQYEKASGPDEAPEKLNRDQVQANLDQMGV